MTGSLPRRLRRWPVLGDPPAGRHVRVADRPWRRLAGLAGIAGLPPGVGILLPGTRAVHTHGMRFALDLVWLDGAGRVVRVDRGVAPWRMRRCRAARAVVELPAAARPAPGGA